MKNKVFILSIIILCLLNLSLLNKERKHKIAFKEIDSRISTIFLLLIKI